MLKLKRTPSEVKNYRVADKLISSFYEQERVSSWHNESIVDEFLENFSMHFQKYCSRFKLNQSDYNQEMIRWNIRQAVRRKKHPVTVGFCVTILRNALLREAKINRTRNLNDRELLQRPDALEYCKIDLTAVDVENEQTHHRNSNVQYMSAIFKANERNKEADSLMRDIVDKYCKENMSQDRCEIMELFMMGLSTKEISESLLIKEATVLTNIHRGKEQLIKNRRDLVAQFEQEFQELY